MLHTSACISRRSALFMAASDLDWSLLDIIRDANRKFDAIRLARGVQLYKS